ncbi:MAG TPA: ATP-binding protein [Opitutaceae bacterium]|nr:ATP-binding protein [Opitutaceae bacterium]
MAAPNRRLRFSLETKVMVAVLAVLVTLPAITLWIVDQHLHEQMQRDAELALTTARGSFAQALKARADGLAARFRSGRFDTRFLQVVRLGDAATMKAYLDAVLEEYRDETELALFFQADGRLMTSAHRGPAGIPAEEFAAAAERHVRATLQTGEQSGTITGRAAAYHLVAVSVVLPERPGEASGALVFGMRISDAVLRSLQPPAAEILVVAGGQVAASTLNERDRTQPALTELAQRAARPNEEITVHGERFVPATGNVGTGTLGPGLRYVFLASAEERLKALAQTRATLFALSAAGILVSVAVVWFFVRRVTRPLVELRGSAEAVGRGDFSHRVQRVSNDEFGELAQAFNQMIASLQSSRAELERAMQQLRATQEQLIQSEKLSAVGQFVAGVAHELNNPLTAVVGFSELLQTMGTDDKMRAHLDRIAKSAHRCHKIVHSLLSFARQHPPERKLVSLHDAIDEVLEIMAYEFRTSNVTVVREFAPDLPAIMADAHQLQQVFVNILGNARQAIEAVQREGRIVIRTRHSSERMVVEFEDNGPGIRPEHLARIFDPFFTTKPVGKGTGLGLSLCYGLVQEHGGVITARSEPGQGAVFAIELPMAATDTAPPVLRRGASAAPFAVPRVPGAIKRVLVIDDEQWILELAAEILRGEGYSVETAVGGEEAIVLLRRQPFNVIVSDWKMPGLNGMRLYEHLRATDPVMAQRMLFMSGDVVSDKFQDFLREHELTCLSKPFAAIEFRAAVARVFGAAQ